LLDLFGRLVLAVPELRQAVATVLSTVDPQAWLYKPAPERQRVTALLRVADRADSCTDGRTLQRRRARWQGSADDDDDAASQACVWACAALARCNPLLFRTLLLEGGAPPPGPNAGTAPSLEAGPSPADKRARGPEGDSPESPRRKRRLLPCEVASY